MTAEPEWRRQAVAIPVRLGDLRLVTARLVLDVSTRHFSTLGETVPEPPVALRKGAAGWLVRSQPVALPLPRLSATGGMLRYVPSQYRRHYVDLSGSAEDYLKGFSAKSRSTLMRKLRRFAETAGGLDFRVYAQPDEMAAFHHQAREVSARTYQERLFDSGLPGEAGFIDRMERLAAGGNARGFLLSVAGAPVAYIFCPARDGVLSYDYVGFDPSWRKHSPGTVLQWLALQHLFAEGGFRMFDFTEGEGEHKSFFGNRSTPCADIYMLRPRPKAIAAVLGQAGVDGISESAGRMLERLGLKARIKHLIRFGWG